MFVKEACRLFLSHCEEERRLSVNTVSAYGQDLKEFRSRFGEVAVASVTGEDLVRYASYLREERSLAPATVKRRIACLKSMFGWLRRRKVVDSSPFRDVDVRVRVPDRLPRCLTPGEAKSLLVAADGASAVTRLAVRLCRRPAELRELRDALLRPTGAVTARRAKVRTQHVTLTRVYHGRIHNLKQLFR